MLQLRWQLSTHINRQQMEELARWILAKVSIEPQFQINAHSIDWLHLNTVHHTNYTRDISVFILLSERNKLYSVQLTDSRPLWSDVLTVTHYAIQCELFYTEVNQLRHRDTAQGANVIRDADMENFRLLRWCRPLCKPSSQVENTWLNSPTFGLYTRIMYAGLGQFACFRCQTTLSLISRQ